MKPTIFSSAGLLMGYCSQRPKLLEAITDSLAGQPRAQSYDGDGASSEPWCWKHGRPVSRCHAEDHHCSGEVVSTNDPTGNAAVSGDPAAKHKAELERLESEVIDRVERIDTIRGLYLPKTLPTGAERAKLATAGEEGCFFCAQAKTWSPPHTKTPTTVGGNLTVPRLVCSGHYDLIRKYLGRAPSPKENTEYVRTGKYPRRAA